MARYEVQQKMDELRQKQQEAFDIITGKRSSVAAAEKTISMAGVGDKTVSNVRNLHSAAETESIPSRLVTIKKGAYGNDKK